MLFERHYEPKEGEVLYHYCDANSFFAICDTRRLRLSDFFSMNDFTELHWGYHIWELAASELLDDVGKEFLDKMDEIIHLNGLHILLVGSCLSLDGDVLSQWRAYSDDGKGYAIGFDAAVFNNLQVTPVRVLYDKRQQIDEVKLFVKSVYDVEQDQEVKFSRDFKMNCMDFACNLIAFKNPAFVEEKEVRVVHALIFEESNKSLKLRDEGGTVFGKDVEGEVVKFRMKGEIPVGFIDIDFSNGGTISPIKEVVLGPKNDAVPMGISVFLETLGVGNVRIRKSKAPYR